MGASELANTYARGLYHTLGGPLAALRDADLIEIDIDIPKRMLDVRLSEEELRARMASWQLPNKEIPAGFMCIYAERVGPASNGVVLLS
jgi:dihydroxyacid dehydratase/phosphogluconate dehydratase